MYSFKMDIIKVSTNKIYAGVFWSERKEYKNSYLKLVQALRLPFKTTKLCELCFSFTFKSYALDSSNCSFMGKMIEDALVKTGVLVNDNINYIGKVSYASSKGKEDSVIVTIKEFEG